MRELKSASPEELKEAHELGCYSCRARFTYPKIRHFIHKGKTPLCPSCGIDAVILLNQIPEEQVAPLLKALQPYYFRL